ncbi:hypothetical protein PPYR_04707 [Photinus pyralis]|uniref:Fibronectin type-III domain-containing protein n=1 Tax=Photinus pyralis TaxID=7054 RepID=A0A1Y1M3T9_PHOPY|nr:hypothetical protein PPYR_04704 [Photinus pyralis]KAB0802521.1 hypothetical protein PPYR_04707 [Photinus pyralis]
MDENNIKANLKAANEYLQLLTNLQVEIGNAEQQINTTAKETESEITTVFSHLVTEITNSLINRRDELINNAQEVQRKGVLPLRQCQTIINNKIANTKSFINEGNDLLKSANKKGLVEFNRKSTLLGSLPEVPPLKEVPYISFHYDTNEESNLTNICRQFGDVIHISPVQITSLLERPGAILVEWAISENEDHFVDVQDYHLQWAFGTVNNLESNFHTCYIGPNLQYLVKDLNLNQNYSFRVRCKYEGDTQWSPWSLPQVCQTTIKSFSWVETDNFTLTNDNKIALSLLNTTSFVCSRRIEFNVGYSIEFTFLECDVNLNDNYVGLTSESTLKGSITNSSSVCVEANGSIFGSGVKKITRFPPVIKGSKICFSCVYRDDNKLRINIDCNENRVTYDWTVDHRNIYIVAQFNSPNWKIMID